MDVLDLSSDLSTRVEQPHYHHTGPSIGLDLSADVVDLCNESEDHNHLVTVMPQKETVEDFLAEERANFAAAHSLMRRPTLKAPSIRRPIVRKQHKTDRKDQRFRAKRGSKKEKPAPGGVGGERKQASKDTSTPSGKAACTSVQQRREEASQSRKEDQNHKRSHPLALHRRKRGDAGGSSFPVSRGLSRQVALPMPEAACKEGENASTTFSQADQNEKRSPKRRKRKRENRQHTEQIELRRAAHRADDRSFHSSRKKAKRRRRKKKWPNAMSVRSENVTEDPTELPSTSDQEQPLGLSPGGASAGRAATPVSYIPQVATVTGTDLSEASSIEPKNEICKKPVAGLRAIYSRGSEGSQYCVPRRNLLSDDTVPGAQRAEASNAIEFFHVFNETTKAKASILSEDRATTVNGSAVTQAATVEVRMSPVVLQCDTGSAVPVDGTVEVDSDTIDSHQSCGGTVLSHEHVTLQDMRAFWDKAHIKSPEFKDEAQVGALEPDTTERCDTQSPPAVDHQSRPNVMKEDAVAIANTRLAESTFVTIQGQNENGSDFHGPSSRLTETLEKHPDRESNGKGNEAAPEVIDLSSERKDPVEPRERSEFTGETWQSTCVIIDSDSSDDEADSAVTFVGVIKATHSTSKATGGATFGRDTNSFMRRTAQTATRTSSRYTPEWFSRPLKAGKRRTRGTAKQFNFKVSTEDARREQERLFAEAAARVREKGLQADLKSSHGGPVFTRPVTDLSKLNEHHWRWPDPHSRLGLPRNTSLAVVKKQYRRLARCYHPDKSSLPDTAAKFQAVTEAYHDLSRRTSLS